MPYVMTDPVDQCYRTQRAPCDEGSFCFLFQHATCEDGPNVPRHSVPHVMSQSAPARRRRIFLFCFLLEGDWGGGGEGGITQRWFSAKGGGLKVP